MNAAALLVDSDARQEQVKEERRLLYVAMTRAKAFLYLTWAKSRPMSYRSGEAACVSRFLSPQIVSDVLTKEAWHRACPGCSDACSACQMHRSQSSCALSRPSFAVRHCSVTPRLMLAQRMASSKHRCTERPWLPAPCALPRCPLSLDRSNDSVLCRSASGLKPGTATQRSGAATVLRRHTATLPALVASRSDALPTSHLSLAPQTRCVNGAVLDDLSMPAQFADWRQRQASIQSTQSEDPEGEPDDYDPYDEFSQRPPPAAVTSGTTAPKPAADARPLVGFQKATSMLQGQKPPLLPRPAPSSTIATDGASEASFSYAPRPRRVLELVAPGVKAFTKSATVKAYYGLCKTMPPIENAVQLPEFEVPFVPVVKMARHLNYEVSTQRQAAARPPNRPPSYGEVMSGRQAARLSEFLQRARGSPADDQLSSKRSRADE